MHLLPILSFFRTQRCEKACCCWLLPSVKNFMWRALSLSLLSRTHTHTGAAATQLPRDKNCLALPLTFFFFMQTLLLLRT